MEANQDNDDAARFPAEVKLPKFKIRILKKPAEAEGEVKSYFCKECDKSFSSGKALGGHKSTAHVQAKKGYSFKKMSFSMKPESSSASASPTVTCSECDKVFLTHKSLYGHMRSHPERGWRGIEPPKQHSMAEDGGVDDQINYSGHELGFHVNGWPKSKRRRGAKTASGSDKEKGTLKIPKSNGGEIDQEKPSGGAKEMEKIQNQSSKTLILGGGGEIESEGRQLKIAIEVLVRWKIEADAAEAAEMTSSSSSNLGPDFFPTHHSHSHSQGAMPIKKKKKKTEKLVKITNTSTAAATGNEPNGDGAIESSSAEKVEDFPFTFDLNMAAPMEEDE